MMVSVAVDQHVKLDGMSIIGAVQTDIEIANDVNWCILTTKYIRCQAKNTGECRQICTLCDRYLNWSQPGESQINYHVESVCVGTTLFIVLPVLFFIFSLILIGVCICLRHTQMRRAVQRQQQYCPVNLQPLPAPGEYDNMK